MKFYSISFILVFFVSFISAQTSKDFDDKYGEIKVYRIRPDIIMTASFNEQGKVCKSRIEKYSGNEETVYLNVTFSSFEIKEILDELLPQRETASPGNKFSTRGFYAETELYKMAWVTYWHKGEEEVDTNIITMEIKWRTDGCKRD